MALIYIAGPVDLAGDFDDLASMDTACRMNGWVTYCPWLGIRAPSDLREVGAEIQRANFAIIDECDGVLALVNDTTSVGTMADLCNAVDAGKPIVVWWRHDAEPSAYLYSVDVERSLTGSIQRLKALLMQGEGNGGLPCVCGDQGMRPTRAHPDDAGLDLYTNGDWLLEPGEAKDIGTGLKIALPPGTFGWLVGRSSALRKKDLHIYSAIVDAGWRGELWVYTRNIGKKARWVFDQDRIAQLIVLPFCTLDPVCVKELPPGTRGEEGVGSSGD